MLQIMMVKHDSAGRDNAYAEFIKSMKQTDKEFVRRMLEEYEKADNPQDAEEHHAAGNDNP